eukprot:3086602-Pyramimonas_sp.AAC.1
MEVELLPTPWDPRRPHHHQPHRCSKAEQVRAARTLNPCPGDPPNPPKRKRNASSNSANIVSWKISASETHHRRAKGCHSGLGLKIERGGIGLGNQAPEPVPHGYG